MSKARGSSPRKFSEKIALLNKKEAEATAEFEKIIKEVEETTRVTPYLHHNPQQQQQQHQHQQHQHPNQPQQQQQQYWSFPTRSSSFSNWQTSSTDNQNYHQQAQFQQIRQQPQQQQAFYPDQNNRHPDNYVHEPATQHLQQNTQQVHHVQPHSHLGNGIHQTSNNIQHQQQNQHQTAQPIRVPNIAIFPIDDNDFNYGQQNHVAPPATTTLTVQDNNHMSNGYMNDCSTSISSARSLPNIANLSVTGSPTYHSGLSPAFSQQRLSPVQVEEYSNNGSQQTAMPAATTTTAETTTLITDGHINCNSDHVNDYATDTNSSFLSDHQQDYCSLPIQSTYQTIASPTQSATGISHQHEDRLSPGALNPSWQPLTTSSSVPSSNATTPPTINEYCEQLNGMPQAIPIHQPPMQAVQRSDIHTNNQQLRPQQMGFAGPSTMVRASSTNVINSFENTTSSNLLSSRPINSNLSRSTEACYGYLPS